MQTDILTENRFFPIQRKELSTNSRDRHVLKRPLHLPVIKTRTALLGSGRIPDRVGSDRIGSDRIGLVSSLFVKNYYFEKSCFHNDTGGSE